MDGWMSCQASGFMIKVISFTIDILTFKSKFDSAKSFYETVKINDFIAYENN